MGIRLVCHHSLIHLLASEAVENLLRLERKLVDRGERPPAAKLIVIGFGMPAHVTSEGIVVAPVDTLGI